MTSPGCSPPGFSGWPTPRPSITSHRPAGRTWKLRSRPCQNQLRWMISKTALPGCMNCALARLEVCTDTWRGKWREGLIPGAWRQLLTLLSPKGRMPDDLASVSCTCTHCCCACSPASGHSATNTCVAHPPPPLTSTPVDAITSSCVLKGVDALNSTTRTCGRASQVEVGMRRW